MNNYPPILEIDTGSEENTFSGAGLHNATPEQIGAAVTEYLKNYKFRIQTYDGPPSELELGACTKRMKDQILLHISIHDPFGEILAP